MKARVRVRHFVIVDSCIKELLTFLLWLRHAKNCLGPNRFSPDYFSRGAEATLRDIGGDRVRQFSDVDPRSEVGDPEGRPECQRQTAESPRLE